MTYACSAPERGLSLWDWTVGALHQDRCSVGVFRVGSELSGSLLQYNCKIRAGFYRISTPNLKKKECRFA